MKRFIPALAMAASIAASMVVSTAWSAPAQAAPAAMAANPPAADTTVGPLHGVAIVFSCVLQVEESEKAAVQVIARAESLGGWFTRRAKTTLELRIPSAQADSFINGLASLGIPMDRTLSTQSVEGELNELASRLKARRGMLQDFYAMLKESSDSTLFTIQNEIVSLQTEIEQTTGQIRKLQDRMDFAEVTVHFRFQERGAPLTTGKSRFGWLNRLDLPTMMEGFDYVRH
jgi:uncharacterized protein DUF4349